VPTTSPRQARPPGRRRERQWLRSKARAARGRRGHCGSGAESVSIAVAIIIICGRVLFCEVLCLACST